MTRRVATRKERGEHARWIGDTAEQAARHLLQVMKLRPRAEDRDDGEDIVVEIVNGLGHLERIYVQVKGAENWKAGSNGAWRVPVRQNAIARYRRLAHPVFLIAVDVATEEMRFLDLSGRLGSGAIASQRFEVPAANVIDRGSGGALEQAMRRAADRRRVANVPATLAQRDQELSAIDPRIGVTTRATGNGIEVRLQAREPVQTILRISADPEHMHALARSFAYGRATQVPLRAMQVDGSPLFDVLDLGSASALSVHSSPVVLSGALGWMDEGGQFQPAFDAQLSAYLGTRGVSVDVHCDGGPIGVFLEGDFGVSSSRGRINFGEGWFDELAPALPYLEETEQFLAALADGRQLAFAGRRHGRYATPTVFGSSEDMRGLASVLLPAARLATVISRVCARFAPGARYRDSALEQEELNWLLVLDRMLSHGEVEGGDIRAEVTDGFADDFSWEQGLPALISTDLVFRLWGHSLAMVPIVIEAPTWSIVGPDANGRRVLQSTEGTPTRIRLLSDADRAAGLRPAPAV